MHLNEGAKEHSSAQGRKGVPGRLASLSLPTQLSPTASVAASFQAGVTRRCSGARSLGDVFSLPGGASLDV